MEAVMDFSDYPFRSFLVFFSVTVTTQRVKEWLNLRLA